MGANHPQKHKMKINTKELKSIYSKAKKDNKYITEEDFLNACKALATRFEKYADTTKKNHRDSRIYVSMKVSRSGMTRHFNFDGNINLVANVIYNNKVSHDPVRVTGCGMDMLWHTLYQCIGVILKDGKENHNSTASYISSLL